MICSFQVHISKYLLCKSWRPFRLCWHSYLSYCWTHAFNGSNSEVLMRTRHLPSGRSTWSMKKCRVTNCPADNKLSRESSPASVRLERDTEQLYIWARIKAHELLPHFFPYCCYEESYSMLQAQLIIRLIHIFTFLKKKVLACVKKMPPRC